MVGKEDQGRWFEAWGGVWGRVKGSAGVCWSGVWEMLSSVWLVGGCELLLGCTVSVGVDDGAREGVEGASDWV